MPHHGHRQEGLSLPSGLPMLIIIMVKCPVQDLLTDEEIVDDYEVNTGKIIIESIGKADPLAVPSVLVNCHGPFCWGTDADDAVYNAISLEEIARIAFYTVLLGKSEPVNRITS